jgi:thermostable 8-oxoguanine DNA glycosylase
LTNVKEEAAMEAGGNIGRGDFSRGNLNVIVRWKMEGVHLNRVMSYVDLNTDTEISSALSAAITARTEADAIEILDRLHGVGVPVASAIMTTINPEKYTIIDIYALRSLGISDAPTDRVEYYVAYLEKCRELAQEFEVSLRTLDHALWQWGYEH